MHFFKKIISITISVIFSILLIELFLYVDNYRPNYKKYSKNINNFTYTTNDEIKIVTDNNFVVLGDSFTHAEVCAKEKKDFVNILKNKLSNKNVYNFGVNGGSPIHYINILSNLDNQNIDKLLIVLYYNDINLTYRNCNLYNKLKEKISYFPKNCENILNSKVDTQNDTLVKKIDNFFETKFLFWSLLKEGLANAPYLKKLYNRSSWDVKFQNEDSDEFKAIVNDLKYLKSLSSKNNIELTFTYFPDVHFLKPNYPRAVVWKNFINKANNFNIKIYDPWDYFLSNTTKTDLSWSLVDKHADCEANQIMANYLETIL